MWVKRKETFIRRFVVKSSLTFQQWQLTKKPSGLSLANYEKIRHTSFSARCVQVYRREKRRRIFAVVHGSGDALPTAKCSAISPTAMPKRVFPTAKCLTLSPSSRVRPTGRERNNISKEKMSWGRIKGRENGYLVTTVQHQIIVLFESPAGFLIANARILPESQYTHTHTHTHTYLTLTVNQAIKSNESRMSTTMGSLFKQPVLAHFSFSSFSEKY